MEASDLFIYLTLKINYNVYVTSVFLCCIPFIAAVLLRYFYNVYVTSVFLCCIPFIAAVLLRYFFNSALALEVSKISDLTLREKFQKF